MPKNKALSNYAIDLNTIINFSLLHFSDQHFYCRILEDNTLKFIPMPETTVEGLKEAESFGVMSEEFNQFLKENNLMRCIVKGLIENKNITFSPEIFEGVSRRYLPTIIRDKILGEKVKNYKLYREAYDYLCSCYWLYKSVKNHSANVYVTPSTQAQIKDIMEGKLNVPSVEKFKRFIELGYVKFVKFENAEQYNEYLEKVSNLYEQYSKDEIIKTAHTFSEPEVFELYKRYVAEASVLMLDSIVSDDRENEIPETNNYILTDAYQRANKKAGYYYLLEHKDSFLNEACGPKNVGSVTRSIRHAYRIDVHEGKEALYKEGGKILRSKGIQPVKVDEDGFVKL